MTSTVDRKRLALLFCLASSGCHVPASDEACPTCTTPDLASVDGGAAAFSAVCDSLSELRATATSTTSVALAWKGAPGVSVTIARKTYCGTDDYVMLKALPAGAAAFEDVDVQPSFVYWYALTAFDARGDVTSESLSVSASANPVGGCCCGTQPQPSDVVPAVVCGM